MAKDDLLKEAVADAKAVVETAIANAKAVLEEQFAPKLQSMLNATLQNEADDEFGTGEGDDEFGAEAPAEDDLDAPAEDELDAPVETGEKFTISGEVTLEPAAGDEVVPDEEDTLGEPESLEGDVDGEENLDEDEFSMDNIVKALEEEAAAMHSDENPLEEKFGKSEAKEGKSEAKEGKSEEKEEVNEDEQYELGELIAELKREYSEATTDNTEELNEVKRNLEEHRNVIKYLRTKLNEVNLLNAKLLFTNKLFKKHSMNESQKLRVIETLDRATTLKECKLVYSTLEEAFNGMKQAFKTGQARKIVESIASKPIASTKPSAETVEKSIINEGTELAARFQKLAGITK